MPKPPVTVNDVAKAAGVSPSTVSRILNGTTAVHEAKRSRVQAAIAKLGYRPNKMARSLKTGQSMSIGVLTQEVDSLFYARTLRGIEFALSNTGYHPLFAGGHWQEQDSTTSLELLLSRSVDGLIVLDGIISDQRLREVAQQTSLVMVGRVVSGLEKQCIVVDNRRGAFEATQFLLSRNHRRIAYLAGPQSRFDARERLAGYKMALEAAAVVFDPDLVVEGDYNEHSGLLGLETLLMRGKSFSAVFCANDQMALGARLGMYRHHIRVPEDVALLGFDDIPTVKYAIPPLSTIRQPMIEMGEEAVRLMLSMLEGREHQAQPLEMQLVLREST